MLDLYGNDTDYVLDYGLRNPWKFDIDNSGQLWIADVGQYCYEEINLVPIFDQTNFGWSQREGMHNYDPSDDCTSAATTPDDSNLTDPIVEYAHTGGNCSITGGFWMDWGPNSLQGGYIYGDFCSLECACRYAHDELRDYDFSEICITSNAKLKLNPDIKANPTNPTTSIAIPIGIFNAIIIRTAAKDRPPFITASIPINFQ